MIALIKGILFRLLTMLKRNPDGFLKKATGVIHVGANTGQEIQLYAKHGLRVIWIEPIPEAFQILKKNLNGFSGQQAIEALVTDLDNVEYQFNISNNEGVGSSILDLNQALDIWPDFHYEKTIKIESKTLTSLIRENNINESDYDTLIMDTQGSELLVLKGAIPILQNFKYVKTEVADFDSYVGCCQLKDIDAFLTEYGYSRFSISKFAKHPNGGAYYDVTYKLKNK